VIDVATVRRLHRQTCHRSNVDANDPVHLVDMWARHWPQFLSQGNTLASEMS
jgi:hypothetical protein